MARTTAAAVRELLGGDYDGKRSLTAFIDTATAIVTRVVTCATRKGITLTTAELELIERWLAAHCYTRSDPTYSSRSTGGASGSFHGQTGLYLDGSYYGQQAKMVDYSGCLGLIGNAVASAFWLGKAPSEQTDYVDRD